MIKTRNVKSRTAKIYVRTLYIMYNEMFTMYNANVYLQYNQYKSKSSARYYQETGVHQQWVFVVYPMTQSNKTDAMRSWINTKPKPNPISKSSSCHYIRRWVQLRYVHCQSWSSQTPTQSYCRGWGCWTHFCIIFTRPILPDEPSL